MHIAQSARWWSQPPAKSCTGGGTFPNMVMKKHSVFLLGGTNWGLSQVSYKCYLYVGWQHGCYCCGFKDALKASVPGSGGMVVTSFIGVWKGQCLGSDPRRGSWEQVSRSGSQKLKTPNNPIKRWRKDLSRHLSKEDIQMVKKHMKRGSTSLMLMIIEI